MATESSQDTLNIARSVLKILRALNFVGLGLVLLVLVGSFVAEALVLEGLENGSDRRDPRVLIVAVRIVMILGIAAVPLAHLIFSRLLAMVDTVRSGDPFVSDNARRLTIIAWALLGLQIVDLGFGAVSLAMAADVRQFDWSFGLTGWIAVLMLFVLARVFHRGARMREELEGTV